MWWFSRVPYHLPKARGKFLPGCVDVSLEYARSGLFMRMFYPTEAVEDEKIYQKWQSCFPDHNYITGLSQVIMISSYLIRFFYWKSGPMRIPVLYGEKPKTNKKLRCIIFSHGLGAYRSMYSTFCCEMASRGYLVVAIEHRDESACHTYFYKSSEEARDNIQTYIKYRKINLGGSHYEERHKQVHFRANECERVLSFLKDLQSGIVPKNVLDNVPSHAGIAFKLIDLVGHLDLDNVTIAGHSFGGATALLALSRRPELKQGVILDPWMFSLKEEDITKKITQPLLFVNTQTFHIEPNVNSMKKYLDVGYKREMYTILHTTHENQADPLFWSGYWLNWFTKKLDPLKGMLINNSLVLRFLQETAGNHTEGIDDCLQVLEEESKNIVKGLTKPWQ